MKHLEPRMVQAALALERPGPVCFNSWMRFPSLTGLAVEGRKRLRVLSLGAYRVWPGSSYVGLRLDLGVL